MRGCIAFTRRLSPAYRHLGLRVSGVAPTFRPGQFVMVRPLSAQAPFLGRAFSIYRMGPGPEGLVIEILYKVVGKGTQCLAQLEPGTALDVLGPFGNAFTLPRENEIPILVAGGIGVPPIVALAKSIANRDGKVPSAECQALSAERERRASNVERAEIPPRPPLTKGGWGDLHVFLGGRTSEDILCVKDFEEAGAEVAITTEDGSLGTRGLITDVLETFLAECRVPGAECRESSREPRAASRDLGRRTPDLRPLTSDLRTRVVIYTCGPPGMLAAVARLAEEYGVPCQTSVEASMACGFGACMGCAIEVVGPGPGPSYKLVCKDGPVFDSRQIVWSAGCRVPSAEREQDEPRAASREPREDGGRA